MEQQNHRGKFGGWTTKTSKERAEKAQEARWAEKSGEVETHQQSVGQYMEYLMTLSPEELKQVLDE